MEQKEQKYAIKTPTSLFCRNSKGLNSPEKADAQLLCKKKLSIIEIIQESEEELEKPDLIVSNAFVCLFICL